jgi:leader peptidase (prepilin peptidase)/N-methyltransferase
MEWPSEAIASITAEATVPHFLFRGDYQAVFGSLPDMTLRRTLEAPRKGKPVRERDSQGAVRDAASVCSQPLLLRRHLLHNPLHMILQFAIPCAVFVFALGACIGSFLNVVIWRLPYRGREVLFKEKRGALTLSWPPSHCPNCDAGIEWYQNIPIFSWLALKARCATCRIGIPIRYPLVELGTALLFLGFFLAYFLAHWPTPNAAPANWVFTDIRLDYAPFALHLVFIAALLAASAIDADLYIIPLSIPYLIMLLALVSAPFIESPAIPHLPTGENWWLAKPVAGAAVGLIAVNILMALKLVPRSFSGEVAEAVAAEAETAAGPKEEPLAPPPKLTKFIPSIVATVVLVAGSVVSWFALPMATASLVTVSAAIAIFLIGVLPRDAGQMDVTDEVMEEISQPHVRREVMKELWFLAIPAGFAVAAYFLPFELPQLPWLVRLLGVILGILAGGAVVWMIRIGGTLAFNKEAMGMGDAHLMAGVGAILGCPLVLIAFFLAPFVALLWALVLKLLGKPNVLPFGPWLSVGSILCLLLGRTILACLFP